MKKERKYVLTLENFKKVKYNKINENNSEEEKAIKALQASHSVLLSDNPNEKYFNTHDLFNEGGKRLVYMNIIEGSGIEKMEMDMTESFIIFNGREAYHVSLSPEYIAKDIDNGKSLIVPQREGNNDLYTKIQEFNEKFLDILEGGTTSSSDIDDMINYINNVFDDYKYDTETVSYGSQIPEIDTK